jgi:DHA1 family bicyclomycin/chloramphenicol resistance-like MFS transporter
MQKFNTPIFLFIVVLCLVIGHVQNDMVSPSFPDMIIFFHTTSKVFHLMSSACSLGMIIGGLLFGPLSDSFGRKKTLLLGLGILAASCIGVQLSTEIYGLICFRFIQGIGMAAPITICVAMIFDVYDKQKARELVGRNNAIFVLAKSIVPILGGYLNVLVNWQINFLILGVSSIIAIVLVTFYTQETSKFKIHNPSKHAKNSLRVIFRNYAFLLSDKIMLSYICVLGFMGCALITYSIGASIVYINHLGVGKDIYGIHQGAIWAIFALFCFLNHSLVRYTRIPYVRKLGFVLIILGCVSLNIVAHFHTTALLITLGMSLCSAGCALLITNLFTDAMSLHPNLKGSSSSILASCRMLFVAVTVAIAGYFFDGTIFPLAYIVSILLVSATLIYIIVLRPYYKTLNI